MKTLLVGVGLSFQSRRSKGQKEEGRTGDARVPIRFGHCPGDGRLLQVQRGYSKQSELRGACQTQGKEKRLLLVLSLVANVVRGFWELPFHELISSPH